MASHKPARSPSNSPFGRPRGRQPGQQTREILHRLSARQLQCAEERLLKAVRGVRVVGQQAVRRTPYERSVLLNNDLPVARLQNVLTSSVKRFHLQITRTQHSPFCESSSVHMSFGAACLLQHSGPAGTSCHDVTRSRKPATFFASARFFCLHYHAGTGRIVPVSPMVVPAQAGRGTLGGVHDRHTEEHETGGKERCATCAFEYGLVRFLGVR